MFSISLSPCPQYPLPILLCFFSTHLLQSLLFSTVVACAPEGIVSDQERIIHAFEKISAFRVGDIFFDFACIKFFHIVCYTY